MKKILFFAVAIFVLACKQEKDPKTELLYGAWKGSAWIIAGQDDNNAKSVQFEFKADGTYSAGFGGQTEKGTFKLKDNKLYTTAENKIEKMVALSKLTKDSIVMDMNRQGQAEQLFLLKK
jgi:Lipocalin-like domain